MSKECKVKFSFNQKSKEDFALYATDEKGAELLGTIYDLWERGKLSMGSLGPAGTTLAEMLCVNNEDQFSSKPRRKKKHG